MNYRKLWRRCLGSFRATLTGFFLKLPWVDRTCLKSRVSDNRRNPNRFFSQTEVCHYRCTKTCLIRGCGVFDVVLKFSRTVPQSRGYLSFLLTVSVFLLRRFMLESDMRFIRQWDLRNGIDPRTTPLHGSVVLILILIYLLTAIGLTPGGSSTLHIYTQTINRTTPSNRIPRTEHT